MKKIKLWDSSNLNDALKYPHSAYMFALKIKGADIQKCQEVACKLPEYAYKFAKYISGADIKYCQKYACE